MKYGRDGPAQKASLNPILTLNDPRCEGDRILQDIFGKRPKTGMPGHIEPKTGTY